MKSAPDAIPIDGPGLSGRAMVWALVGLLVVEGLLLTCLSAGLIDVYGGALVLIILLYAVLVERPSAVFFIALLPLSQPLPVGFGARAIGVPAEFIVIPAMAFHAAFTRVRNNELAARRRYIVGAALLFLGVATISLIQGISMTGLSAAASGFGTLYNFILALLLFLVLTDWMEGSERIPGVVFGLIASYLLISVVGVIQYFVQTPAAGFTFRATSLFGTIFWKEGGGNPNVFGTYLMIMSLFAVIMRSQFAGWRRFLVTVSIPIGLLALFFSSSRSSVIAFLVGLLLVSGLTWRKVAMLLFPLVAGVVAVIESVPRLGDRIRSVYELATDPRVIQFFASIDPRKLDWQYIHYFGLGGYNIDLVAGALRITYWISGIKIFLGHPLLGVGLKMNVQHGPFETADNLLLDIGIMTGVLGLAAFFWLVVRILLLIGRAERSATSPIEKAFVRAYRASIVGCVIVSMTGSVLFGLKLLILLSVLTSLIWAIASKKPAA